MNSEFKITYLLPVLFAFFVMGFCDLVGVSVTYAQAQFGWTETQAGFLPSMVFFWFLVLSIPVAYRMNKWGRKNTVLFSMFFTFTGMILPFILFNEIICYLSFVLLGIGNTIQQVSLNPLLTNVVSKERLTSSLTAGNFIKAISSLSGPLIAGICYSTFGRWELIFPIYAGFTLVSFFWLASTPLKQDAKSKTEASIKKTFSLLKNNQILLLFIGILAVVGLDVGLNTLAPKLLIERINLPQDIAGYGSSWYFAARTAGTFCGVFILAKTTERAYFRINMIICLLALVGLFFAYSHTLILVLICIIAFAASCIFAVIFSMALRILPDNTNDISGLMITGISGGAIVPPLMGITSDLVGNQNGSLLVIGVCILYLLYCAYKIQANKTAI